MYQETTFKQRWRWLCSLGYAHPHVGIVSVYQECLIRSFLKPRVFYNHRCVTPDTGRGFLKGEHVYRPTEDAALAIVNPRKVYALNHNTSAFLNALTVELLQEVYSEEQVTPLSQLDRKLRRPQRWIKQADGTYKRVGYTDP